jgi:membrane fusion protein (multidrug efflux system)
VNELQGAYLIGVVGPDGKVEVRTVRAGEQVGTQWIIEEGLQPADKVIVEGFARVRPGDAVRATAASDGAPATAAAAQATSSPSAGR